jgi:hypothetical protein
VSTGAVLPGNDAGLRVLRAGNPDFLFKKGSQIAIDLTGSFWATSANPMHMFISVNESYV